jgi:hypothetical protein
MAIHAPPSGKWEGKASLISYLQGTYRLSKVICVHPQPISARNDETDIFLRFYELQRTYELYARACHCRRPAKEAGRKKASCSYAGWPDHHLMSRTQTRHFVDK